MGDDRARGRRPRPPRVARDRIDHIKLSGRSDHDAHPPTLTDSMALMAMTPTRSGARTSSSSRSATTGGCPSASLIPAGHDPSALFTVAGMHPLKPYFLGLEPPPHRRGSPPARRPSGRSTSTSSGRPLGISRSSRCSATSRSATTSSARRRGSPGSCRPTGFGFPAEDIWITVFAGDDELGLGPDEEAIEAWLEIGVPRERIVECPRSENFWECRPDRALRPVLGAVPRPRPRVRQARRPPRRRQRALPRVLEPRVHAVRPEPGERADAAAGEEHRHRPRAQPDGGDPPGQADGVRDRPVRAADRARRGALAAALRRRTTRPTGRCASSPTTRAR